MPVRKGRQGWEVRRVLRRGFGGSKAHALRYAALVESALAEVETKFQMGERGCCSIHDKLEEFISDRRAGLGKRSCQFATARRHRRRLETFDRAFHGVALDRIKRTTVENWVKRRLAAGVGPDTVNADLVSLRAFARWAIKKSYAPAVLPLMLVERLYSPNKLPGVNRKPPKALEMGELLRYIEAIQELRPDVALFLRGMILFGLRPFAVAGLRRRDVKLPRGDDPGRLYCRGLKGMHDRDIPIVADSPAHQWLVECLAMGERCRVAGNDGVGIPGHLPLAPCLGTVRVGGKRPRMKGWTTNSLDMVVYRLCRKLKIRFTPYQVRHTCISYLQAHGHSLAAVQVYAGHGKVTTQAAYAHRHVREAVAAYQVMGEVVEGLIA